MSYKVLIVGLGQIGMGYDLHLDPSAHVYSHARAFSQHKKFSLIAGVDGDEQVRQRFESAYHCPAYFNINQALHHAQPDVVVISVPTQLHGECLRQLLGKFSPKLVLCEKPLSYSLKEAEAMVQACHQKGVRLYVNYMRRSEPGTISIKRRLEDNTIKKPVKGIVWYSKGFLHNGSHFFNLLEYWLGKYKNSFVLNPGRLVGDNDQEPDVQVTFEQGSVTFFAAWEEAFSHHTIELLSASGRLRYEQGGEVIKWESLQSDPCFEGYTVLSDVIEQIPSGMKHYQRYVVEQLARVLDGEDAQLCTGIDALHTLNNMQQVLKDSL